MEQFTLKNTKNRNNSDKNLYKRFLINLRWVGYVKFLYCYLLKYQSIYHRYFKTCY